jgi:hypothetical protein
MAGACMAPTPSPRATNGSAPASAPASAAGSAAPNAAMPGRPYDAEMVLAAMRTSRRPGGVPDQLETQAIAATVADGIWTFDGLPWATMSVGGSCGPASCTLEVGGAPADAIGEDVYVMSVGLASGEVILLERNLRGLPSELAARLDATARAMWAGDLSGLTLATVQWSLPPNASVYLLSYRSGGEEGAPGVDLRLDIEAEAVTAP